VTVKDVDVYFEVMLPPDADAAAFELEVISVLVCNGIEYARHELIKAKRFIGYTEEPSDFLRIFFYSKTQRRKGIDVLRTEGYQTTSDDETCYYRKLSRDYSAPFSDWLQVTPDEDVDRNDRYQNCIAVPEGICKAPRKPERDPTLVMTWDIEAYSDSGEVPMPENVDDIMYMICCTFHWLAEEEPIYRVCLIDKDVVPDEGYADRPASERIQTVVCGSQLGLIRAFALLVEAMMPDIITGFNDSGYDWPFLITKAKMLGQIQFLYEHMNLIPAGRRSSDDIFKWCVARKTIKIGGSVGEIYGEMLNLTGYVPIDSRVCMVRQFKDEEVSEKKTSLDFYLGVNGLPTKIELPYHEQFKIYREGDREKLGLIRGYCDRDAVSCHLLLSKQQIVGFLRIVGELSFLSLWDAHTTANGIKVPNAVIEDANRNGVLMSAIYVRPSEEEAKKKYGGAKVFPPIKGLHNERPTLPFDYASLYPSLMQSFNISPDMYVATEEEAERLKAAGRTIFEIDLEYDGQKFKARFVRHDNDISRMGLIPRILVDLLAVRNGIRKRQKVFDKESVEWGKLEIQQLAVKVLMNSFYGVMGMKGHALYLLPVALAITTAGRMMITMVADYVQSLGWTIVYGDTDSVYLRPPDHYFAEIDAEYKEGKIAKMEHWTKMVEISLDICQGFGKEINDMISSYTGNTYLRMEDEGVKFPMLMTGKKKYAGIAHKPGGIDFFPKKLFVRGIDFIKTGQMRLAITLGNKILRQALHIDNDREVLEIVEEIFKDAVTNTTQWSTDDFVETKTYKPKKKNVCVLRFAERMRERDERMRAENVRRAKRGEPPLPRPFEPPAPGQKFKCLVVKPKSVYSLDGKKLKLSIGDLMEYAEVVKDQSNGFEVDVPHYMAGKVATACARFINYHELFTPPEGLDERKADEFSINAAKAYVKKIVDRYVEKPIHHQICKRAYKRVTQAVADELGDSAQMLAVLGATGGEVDSVADVMDAGLSEFAAYLVRVARGQISESRAKREARAIIKEATGGDTRAQLKMLRAMNKIRSGYVELLREEILECAPLMRKMLSTYTDCLERMVVSMRTAMASGSDATMDRCAVRMGMDSESLAKADEFWIKLRSAVYLDVREEMLLDELAKVRRSISGASV
jgi:DNA polymerase elongation subunit (family B)